MTGGIFNGAADEGIFGLGTNGSASMYTSTPGGTVGGDVRAAQTILQQGGFDLGPTGVDGAWGPCTAGAMRNYIAAKGEQAAVHVFGTTLVARARSTTGACARAARTGGTTPTSTTAPGTAASTPPAITERRAGIFQLPEGFSFPGSALLTEWWFWLAVAGVAGVGYMGIRYYQKKKEEEEVEAAEPDYGPWSY